MAFEAGSSVVSPDQLALVRSLCGAIHEAMILLLRRSRVRGFSLLVVVTHDLAAELVRLEPVLGIGAADPVTRRLGGTVVAKTLPPREDGGPFTVVLDDALWLRGAGGAGAGAAQDQTIAIATVAHELAHCAIESTRAAAGCVLYEDGLTTGQTVAREVLRGALDEYRADLIEDLFLQALADATEDGVTLPLRLHDAFGREFCDALGAVLTDEVYPGWPDRVQRVRDLQVPLDEFWAGLVRSTWGVFVTLAHAGSVAYTAGESDPALSEFVSHPAVRLYLWEPWACVLEIARSARPVCSAAAQAKMEARAFSEGVDALLRMWARLGLSFTLLGDGRTAIEVADPLRDTGSR